MRELSHLEGLHPRDLTRRQRLLLIYAAGLVSVVLLYTVLYNTGMRTLEDRPQSIFRSFQTVTETMTTTGYGADSPWATPVMNVFMVTMQVTGVVIGFVTLRVLVIPLFERTPLNLDDRLSIKDGHVVVAEYRRDTGVLLDELEQLDVGYVLVESDEEEAKRLSDDGYQAINGDPEDPDDLARASIGKASLLITDAGDRTASVVLTALEANEDLRVVSFTASTRRKPALAEIGVDRSVAPHALIGRRLAEKATTPVDVGTAGGEEVTVREILVRRGSPLHGVSIRDSPLAAHPDLTLVAGWFDGELRIPPSPDDRLTPNTVLVVAGPESDIDEATDEMGNVRRPTDSSHSRVVVAGFGEGGHAALEALPEETTVTTIDDSADANADVTGDVTEPETLRAAGIEDASALVVTVDDDATALLTVAMARSLSPGVEILARVTDADKASPAFRAGADYVLSVQQVCARLVAAEVHGERVMAPAAQIRLVRADADPFVGESLRDARRDTERGWTVVGIVRDGAVRTDERTVVEADDEMVVAGSDEAIQEFERTVDTS
ncbi:Trk K+ transport system, NAD-binding component [Halopelagius inordinatus]|uniref:Trk K+ transport system, NAD-binding component n=1 Tax=Halopelagius inordinatus TaxID=553467 RepID=A0A1I2LT14_9EURY|nr:NAD-binding protein [Halopelagius inordinatus]SFF81659.1 Trk K+ transport system, NAD-binding component [Halopelagius inordinatus]